jgi:ABC-type multidrug transport system ATPase subunit
MTDHHSRAQRIRQELVALKEDRTTYVRSSHVLVKYEELCEVLRAHKQTYGADAQSNGDKSPDQLES